MDKPKFEAGDMVSWCGTAGLVTQADDEAISVKFTNHMIIQFFPDGKYRDWHKEPSLIATHKELLEAQALEEYNKRHNK